MVDRDHMDRDHDRMDRDHDRMDRDHTVYRGHHRSCHWSRHYHQRVCEWRHW
jgi:hypothetical protein